MYKEVWQVFVKEYRQLRMVVATFSLTIAISFLEGINVGLLVPLLETLDPSDPEKEHWLSRGVASLFNAIGIPFELWTILLALGVMILGTQGLKYLRTLLVAKTFVRFRTWIRSRIMWNLVNTDISYFHHQKIGTLSDTIIAQSDHAASTVVDITEMLSNLALVAAYLVTALVLSPALTGVAFVMLLIISLAVQYHIVKAKATGADMVTRHGALQVSALESISGINVIKSFLLERLRWGDLKQKTEAFDESQYRMQKSRGQMAVIQETGLYVLIGGIVFVGVSFLSLEIAVIVALLYVLYRLTPKLIAVNSSRQGIAPGLASLHQVKTIIDDASSPTIVSGETPFTALHSGIELKDVSFSYNGGAEVLLDTSFTIEKGKMTAIAGDSGAGKSTLVDLLLRNYDPVMGSILVDGVDLRDLDLPSWRSSIGVVSQDIFLFNDTVANNISLGRPEITEASLMEAGKQAYAHDFILHLPQGYDTMIGDRGWNLSGGQRQRIALARAIIAKPDILIMDEATSSLDSDSERLIQRYINEIRGTRTIVVVAHRMSTIQNADKIVVLQDGQIVEEGDWDSLLAEAGALSKYHRLQS